MRLRDRTHYVNHLLNNIDQKFQSFLIVNSTFLIRYTAKSLRDVIMGNDQKEQQSIIAFVGNYFLTAVANNKFSIL
jgi:hypothetical protein